MSISVESPSSRRPAPDDGAPDQLLYQSELTRVSRRPGRDGAPGVILKEALGPHGAERLRHERAVLALLAGVAGVSQLAADDYPGALALVDHGAAPLARTLGGQPLPLAELLPLALRLARILAALHRRGIVHRDINPANIVLAGTPPQPELIDFQHAVVLADAAGAAPSAPAAAGGQIAGTLAYLAPEQTGRTGRQVDRRSDLYAFGATLYQLALGRPPFGGDDPLQLIHDQLAALPAAPAEARPELPPALSDLILRLLEKEPDRRYQSAEGLAHDLARLARGEAAFALGERDFPQRLSAPAQLVGRDAEIAALREAFDAAQRSRRRGALVAGAPGVGKSALIGTLRPHVAARGGWVVAGKFDRFRRDLETDAVQQVMQALGRLLLAEPETAAALAARRAHLLAALGPNAGLLAATSPELARLLDIAPTAPGDDVRKTEAQLIQAGLDFLRAIASSARPLVLVIDDLQWAGALSIRFFGAVLEDDALRCVSLVGSYRDAEVDAAHPLSALLARAQALAAPPLRLLLHNLPPADLAALLGQLLRLAPPRAAELAEAIGTRSGGNPFDTVELVNALRLDGALALEEGGWRWDAATIRRFVGASDVVELLAARIGRLPPAAQGLLDVMACLGGELAPALLAAASGLPPDELEAQLALLRDDGLVLPPDEAGALRFRHDRVQQAARSRLAPAGHAALCLRLARRLAPWRQFAAAAAEQYLPAIEQVVEPAERRAVAALFRAAAAGLRLINSAMAERLLTAALGLLRAAGDAADADAALLVALESELQIVLSSLGRLDEASDAYHAIARRCSDPLLLAGPVCIQISGLSMRGAHPEALALGRATLRSLGVAPPAAGQTDAAIGQGLDALRRWTWDGGMERDMERATARDGKALLAGKLMSAMLPPAFFCDKALAYWMALEAHRLWAEHGPCPSLLPLMGFCAQAFIVYRDDYRTAFQMQRRVIAVAERRDFEPYTSMALSMGLFNEPWCEPLELVIRLAQTADAGLLRGGEPGMACIARITANGALFDCAASLDLVTPSLASALELAVSAGNEVTQGHFLTCRQLVRSLQGSTTSEAGFSDATLDDAAHRARIGPYGPGAAYYHIERALGAALFGAAPLLAEHAAAATRLIPAIPGHYGYALARVLQALALARRVHAGRLGAAAADGAAEAAAALAELDACCDWLALRAADCPANFLHLQRLAEAERAWAVGDFRAAAARYDQALHALASVQRPWHRALTAERAGLCHLEHGLEHAGRGLLAEARQGYADWGARGKVAQMERAHDCLRGRRGDGPGRRDGATSASVSADQIDMLAILRASQALSSETSLARLTGRVVELLGALTGATKVWLALWREDGARWTLPAAPGEGEGAGDGAGDGDGAQSLERAGAAGRLPLSAFRYAERTMETLLVDDATSDDRFARDPYLDGLACCSLLAMPVLSHGLPRAMLLMVNDLSRSAFSADRLDAALLIAGQLAVSLENALVYEQLEQRVQRRTAELRAAQAELVGTARRAGMAEIATNVLHNVGNILNSVNISANLVSSKLRGFKVPELVRALRLMDEHPADLGEFLRHDSRGKLLPGYLGKLAQAMAAEQAEAVEELRHLGKSIDHIKDVVTTQQSYAGNSTVLEEVDLRELVDDALRMNEGALTRHQVTVARAFSAVPKAQLDKTRVLQILVNLISNAKQAMDPVAGRPHLMTLTVAADAASLRVVVADVGEGIPAENLTRIFAHGFTTRAGGHGFGLHSCALAARQMGGTLSAHSDGPDRGAAFTLELPIAAAPG